MKRVCGLLLVAFAASVLLVPSTAHAADLQAGWYANILAISTWLYGSEGYRPGPVGWFTTQGQYGPFTATGGSYDTHSYVSVPTTAYGIGSGQSLVLPVSAMYTSEPVAYVLFTYQTYYDPSQMRLELWRNRSDGSQELMWSQLQQGHQLNSFSVAHDSVYEGPFYFKVSVVPEPSSIVCVLTALGCLSSVARRRRVQ
jgi:hypothetical protein